MASSPKSGPDIPRDDGWVRPSERPEQATLKAAAERHPVSRGEVESMQARFRREADCCAPDLPDSGGLSIEEGKALYPNITRRVEQEAQGAS